MRNPLVAQYVALIANLLNIPDLLTLYASTRMRVLRSCLLNDLDQGSNDGYTIE